MYVNMEIDGVFLEVDADITVFGSDCEIEAYEIIYACSLTTDCELSSDEIDELQATEGFDSELKNNVLTAISEEEWNWLEQDALTREYA